MKNHPAAFRIVWIGLALILVAGNARAQEKSGSLHGTIFDDTGAVLPGATVTLTNKSTHRISETTTGPYGDYTVRDIPPGQYSILVSLSGFTRTEFPDLAILVAQNLRLDTQLKPGATSTVIQVTDSAPRMDTQSSSVVTHISQDELDSLPKGRTFEQLANLAAGINVGEIEGGIQINGASGAENAYLIDGVATQSAIDGRQRQSTVFDGIQEIQVQTAGLDASYSGALGGIVSAVTRSGGDQLHGSAWFYYSGDSLSAASPKRLVLDPLDNRTVNYFQDQKGPVRSVEPGFLLSGSLMPRRLYFLTAWSPRWTRQDQLYHFNNGAETGTLRRDVTSFNGFNKLSFDPAAKIRTNMTWLWTPAKATGSLPVYNSTCPNCISSTLASNDANKQRGYFNPQAGYGINADVVLANNVVWSTRVNYFWDNYKDTGIPDITSVQYQAPAVAPLVPPAFQGGVGFQNTPAVLKFDHDRIARTTVQLDLSAFGHFLGTHNFKTGYGVEKTVNNVNGFYPGGYVNVWWDRSFTSPVTGVVDRGAYGYYEVNDFRTLGSTGATTKSFYVQDNWHTNRLTLNIGVRLEKERVPSFRRDIQNTAIVYGWGNKVAPRIGAAFDLFGDGRVKLYGSWGRYFDPTRFELAREVFGAEMWRTYYRSLDSPGVFALNLDNMPGRDLWNPATPNSYRDRRSIIAGLDSVAPELKPMSQAQSSAGVEYQWNNRTLIGVHYVHQGLIRAIEDLAVLVGGNAAYVYANPGEGIAVAAPFVTGLTARPLNYPKPERNYDAVEIRIGRRFADRWFGNFNYTWSRLFGNYSGPASSDELLSPATGLSFGTAQQIGGSIAHPARNANFGWDLDEILFDSKGHLDTRGPLPTDRPHVVKLNGGYELPGGRFGKTSVGTFIYLGSGTPLSTQVYTLNHIPVFVNGRGDMGRSPFLSNTDLQVAHTVSVTEAKKIRIEFNVLNVFNQKTALHRFVGLNRGTGIPVDSSAIKLSSTDLRKGYDYSALILASPDGANALDPRYGKEDLFNDGLAARFAVKWSF